MIGLSNLVFHPNTPYKKNVAKFEVERFEKITKAGFDQTFFMPVEKEKKWQTESPKLIGVVDRVHKCCKADLLSPENPEFKEGDLVIVENKTGKPTPKKCKNYEKDMLWYKIIMEIIKPELAPIKWGAIYFPYDNYVHHCKLKKEDCQELAKSIKTVREDIQTALNNDSWEAKPSKYNCMWCGFKSHCPNHI